jgi:hypothetical protein
MVLSVHPEIVDFGSRQGSRIFSTAGVVRLRRGSKKSENAVLGRKMLFLDGHYLTKISNSKKINHKFIFLFILLFNVIKIE